MLASRGLGASYDRTLTIGRQWFFGDGANLVRAHAEAGGELDAAAAEALVRDAGGFAEPIFRHLGAAEVHSLDASGYESATIVHDLNEPLPDRWRRRYTVVFDGGSLEHVFNFPQALGNCLSAVELGGHFLTITPGNSFLGHGFYQFSPELYFRALIPENGFQVTAVLVRFEHRWARWRQVADPSRLQRRVTLAGPWPTYLYVLAKRVNDSDPFTVWPQQSDYETVWAGGRLAASKRVGPRLRARLPTRAQRAVEGLLAATALTGRRSDPDDFPPVQLTEIMPEPVRRP